MLLVCTPKLTTVFGHTQIARHAPPIHRGDGRNKNKSCTIKKIRGTLCRARAEYWMGRRIAEIANTNIFYTLHGIDADIPVQQTHLLSTETVLVFQKKYKFANYSLKRLQHFQDNAQRVDGVVVVSLTCYFYLLALHIYCVTLYQLQHVCCPPIWKSWAGWSCARWMQ